MLVPKCHGRKPVGIYGARFWISIGLTISELKQHFDLEDYQCHASLLILCLVHLAYVAFCLRRLVL